MCGGGGGGGDIRLINHFAQQTTATFIFVEGGVRERCRNFETYNHLIFSHQVASTISYQNLSVCSHCSDIVESLVSELGTAVSGG